MEKVLSIANLGFKKGEKRFKWSNLGVLSRSQYPLGKLVSELGGKEEGEVRHASLELLQGKIALHL